MKKIFISIILMAVSILILIMTLNMDNLKINSSSFIKNLPSDHKVNILYNVIKTRDNNLVFVGGENNYTKDMYDGLIVKTDINGNVLWNKEIIGINELVFNDIIESNDGGYIIVGHSYSQSQGRYTEGDITTGGGVVAKIDNKGNMLWHFTIGNNLSSSVGGTSLNSVIKIGNGEYIAVGSDCSGDMDNRYSEGIIVKFNDKGSKEWTKNYTGNILRFKKAIKLSNNEFEVIGSEYSEYINKTKILTINLNGDIKENKELNHFSPMSVIELKDHSLVMSGFTATFGEPNYASLIKVDKEGKVVWVNEDKKMFRYDSVVLDKTGNLISFGKYYNSKFVIYNKNGKELGRPILNVINMDSHGEYISGNGPHINIKNINTNHFLILGDYGPNEVTEFNFDARWYDALYNHYPILTTTIGYCLTISGMLSAVIISASGIIEIVKKKKNVGKE